MKDDILAVIKNSLNALRDEHLRSRDILIHSIDVALQEYFSRRACDRPSPDATFLEGYEHGLSYAAFYVQDHCVDGENHANTILASERPKVTGGSTEDEKGGIA